MTVVYYSLVFVIVIFEFHYVLSLPRRIFEIILSQSRAYANLFIRKRIRTLKGSREQLFLEPVDVRLAFTTLSLSLSLCNRPKWL